MFGFRRYFTLENQIVKELFSLAQDPPDEWRRLPIKVVRRDREQTVSGACASALYGACFGIMGANSRAAVNHKIQATGAEMTKELENNIWKLQPSGIHPWRVRPMNVHDEILVVNEPGLEVHIRKIVDDYIDEMKPIIPLLEIEWKDKLNNWSEK
jgi:DNA polymerase I-like protein with 3'-5' exonuclease and polymerase domains